MIYLTSDFHFLHDKEFVYKSRGFQTCEEMNQILIDNFNRIININDDVYILGDLLLGGADNFEKGLGLLAWLNGRLHIIRGNHDSDKRWAAYKELDNVVEIETAMYLKYGKYHFYLSHFPSLCSNWDDKGLKHCTINLCGHSHTTDPFADMDKGLIYHVEVDAHDNYPVCIDKVIEDLKHYRLNDPT